MIACQNCEFIGYPSECKAAPVPALRPGESYTAPYGVCPSCDAVIPHDALETSLHDTLSRHWSDLPSERPNLTQFQRDCLQVALARITPNHPAFLGSPEVSDALNGSLKLYFNSWVRPMIEAALFGPSYVGQRQTTAGDAQHVRAKLTDFREMD